MVDSLRPVPVGACRCPGTPHADGDVVYLAPKLSLSGGLAASAAISISDGPTAVYQNIALALIDHGVADWTFQDDKGNKLPISPATIRGSLPWTEGGSEVANAAIEQYGESVMAPFRKPSPPAEGKKPRRPRAISSSPTGSTDSSST